MSSTTFVGGVRLNDIGVPILREGASAQERAAFFALFWQSTTGQRFRPIATKRNQALLDAYLEKKFSDATEITLPQFEHLVALMLDTFSFPDQQTQATPAAVEDTRPRNPDGTFMSEFAIWANARERSSAEIHDRVRNDAAFATWYRAQLTAQTTQEAPFKIAGSPTRETTTADYEVLGDFVRAYRATPASQLRPRAGFVTLNDNHKYTPEDFEILVDAAAQAGLL